MGDDKPKPDIGDDKELAGLTSRLDELSDLFGKWDSARNVASRTRLGVIVVILVVVLLYGLFLYNLLAQVREPVYLERLGVAGMKALEIVMLEAREPALEAGRDLVGEFQTQARKEVREHADEMNARLQEELETLAGNVDGIIRKKLEVRVADVAERQRSLFEDAFPEHLETDEDLDNVIENLTLALQGATVDVMEHRIDEARKDLERVTQKVLNFLPEERRDGFYAKVNEIWDRLAELDRAREAASAAE
jgi:hypothetical protein